jgi:outer membrane protein TolC
MTETLPHSDRAQGGSHMEKRRRAQIALTTALSLLSLSAAAQTFDNGGAPPAFGSVTTPRPIDPSTGTTNPSARATQTLNPYLGSTTDGKVIDGQIKLSLQDAVDRGLSFNLGLIDSQQADAGVRAQREHAFALLLPQISARAQQTYQQLSFKQLNIKLPPQFGFQLPPTSGNFGYAQTEIDAQSSVLNFALLDHYKEQKQLEAASALNSKDARDVVVFAVGAAYFQVVASQARLATAQAALASARELNTQVTNQFNSEVSPEIDTLRAGVELSTAEQRVVDAANDLEKDKLTLDRITGIPLAQDWEPNGVYGYAPLIEEEGDAGRALETRFDVGSSKREVAAAELALRAARAERLPDISFSGSYGGGGTNPANFNQVYAVGGAVSVPIFTSGRIRSDVHAAEAELVQRRAAYRDLEGRVDYDVRVARLDVHGSESAVNVAAKNKLLAERALTQSTDRYNNGVTNYLELLQAQQALVAANENYIASLFSFNVAKVALARALGQAESRLPSFFGQQ